jgi:acyl-coenzyme A thioesterase 13
MTYLDGGVELWEEGHIIMSMKLEARHMNPGGRLHGAIIAALIDEAAGRAVSSLRREGHATIEMNISFLSSAGPGDEIVCEANALRAGRTFGFAEAEVRRRSDNKLIAKGRATFAIMPMRNEGAP